MTPVFRRSPGSPRPKSESYLRDRDVAERFNVSEKTVARLRQRGELPYVKLPGGLVRIPREEVLAFEERNIRGVRSKDRTQRRVTTASTVRGREKPLLRSNRSPRSAVDFECQVSLESADGTLDHVGLTDERQPA